jgi:hypothetical protein
VASIKGTAQRVTTIRVRPKTQQVLAVLVNHVQSKQTVTVPQQMVNTKAIAQRVRTTPVLLHEAPAAHSVNVCPIPHLKLAKHWLVYIRAMTRVANLIHAKNQV